MVRDTTVNALKGARTITGEAGHLAQDAVLGALQATGKIGAQAGAVIRDSAIGVIEGTGQVATATTTMLTHSGKFRDMLGDCRNPQD